MTPSFDPELLRAVKNLDDVLDFLAEELDWPVGDLGLDDATFDYSPAELGITGDQAPALKAVRQLRPLTAAQPWGIFFVQFAGRKLPIALLRRLLRSVVAKKRIASGTHRTWKLDDLLFFTATDTGETVDLHLIAFFDSGGAQPEVRSLPWNPVHSPRAHLQRLAWELLPHLEWPSEPDAVEAWRASWRQAFKLRHGAALASASELARRMAGTAHQLRDALETALHREKGEGPITKLLEEIRDELLSNVDEERFADMCAQTLVYGALTSRITDPEGFGASPVLTAVPLANLFLASFFEQVNDQVAALGLDAEGLEGLVADLRETDVEAVLDQFGATAAGGDPVIHFYEDFLAEYDSDIRAEVGAFYTPQPVVECIVRLVDCALKERLGLVQGVADDATWGEVCARNDFDVPADVDPNEGFVSVLDPATGTGTFLVEWLRRCKVSWTGGGSQAAWDAFVHASVLPNMRAFELMLAPYAIAHLKVALEVGPEQGRDLSTSILLTDTLELPGPVQTLEELDPVAREGQRAGEVKQQGRPTVIVGNPPYRRVTRSETGGWVANPNGPRPALMQDVINVANERVIFAAVASLYNLYTYFWRWSVWKVFEQAGDSPGVVAFITASSWLDGPGFVGLRELARGACSDIWIVDLGGDNRGSHPEENVFAIETPVAIAILVRAESEAARSEPQILYHRVSGTRREKLEALAAVESPASAPEDWRPVASEDGLSFRASSGDDAWSTMPALSDLFPWQQPGAKLNRTWPVAPDADTLTRRWRAFLADESVERRRALFPDPNSGRKVTTRVGDLPRLADLTPEAVPASVAEYQWRAFDRQWTFEDPRLAKTESPALWQARGEDQLFFATLATQSLGPGPALLAFSAAPDMHVFRGSYGGKDIIPLFRDSSTDRPNVTDGVLAELAARLSGDGGGAEPTPKHLAAYVYGLLSSPGYQERFATSLADRVIRVPLTAELDLFDEAVALGHRMLSLHTRLAWSASDSGGEEDRVGGLGIDWVTPVTVLPASGREIGYDGDARVLRVGDGRVRGVRQEVWDFSVTGWAVVPRWLEHRTARGRGKRGSELDAIRPEQWTREWSNELLDLLRLLTATIDARPKQDDLLDRILSGSLVPADALPTPRAEERAVPATEAPRSSADELPLAR